MPRCKKCARGHKRCEHSIRSRTHLVIPDVQTKPGVPTEHLEWIGKYIADKRPDVIVQIGDFADMPSLSSYDRGKKSFEGRRYRADIDAAIFAMDKLTNGFRNIKGYRPRMVLTLGNHEDRISRAVEEDAKLDGTIGLDDLKYKEFGWEVHDFLKPVVIDGIAYIHYLPTGVEGRPASSAVALVNKGHNSVTVGHIQTADICIKTALDGRRIIGLMCGAAYLHDEDYLPPLQNMATRRQIVMKHEVNGRGDYDPMFVSLSYLKRKYGSS